MFYSYRNCKVLIDESPLFVNSVSISTDSSIEPSINQGRAFPEEYRAVNGIEGTLKMSYYITGLDFLKEYINDSARFLKASFGGLSFETGVITSYSLEGAANSPVNINVNIVFFDNVRGSFTPSYEIFPETKPLNFSDCSLSGFNIGNVSSILGFSYNADFNIETSYFDTSKELISPDNILFGPSQAVLNLTYDNLTGNIPISGQDAAAIINLRSADLTTRDTINVSGKLFKKDISIVENDIIKSTISIRKDRVIPPPIIQNFSPLTGIRNSTLVTLNGENLKTTYQVYYGGKLSVLSPNITDNKILFYPRLGAKTGFFTVITQGGTATATVPFISSGVPIGGF